MVNHSIVPPLLQEGFIPPEDGAEDGEQGGHRES